MGKKPLPERKRLAAVFASFAILIVGTASLMESMSLDYYSVINTVQKVIPAALTLGAMGWVIGMVLDKPKKPKRHGYSNIFTNNAQNESAEKITEPTGDEKKEGETPDSAETK